MRAWTIVLPILGTCLMVTLPLLTYAQKQRAEAVVLDALEQLHEAQDQLKAASGGYATDMASLTTACPEAGTPPPMPAAVLADAEAAGYVLAIRAAANATSVGYDCHGRTLASDYYVAAAPASAWGAAGRAFAGRSDRRLFVFTDGVPPREADLSTGLATPVEALDSFKIP